jgi:TatA/E family protein of Tat protein translocase
MLAEIFGMDALVVVVIIAVVLFGGAAIPKLARNLGSAKNQFEKGLEEGKRTSTPAPVTAREATVQPVREPIRD